MNFDYAKDFYYSHQHFLRFEKYVEREGLTCQDCGGMGGEVEDILGYGQGPWYECGWCLGTGRVTRWLRGQWLKYKREDAREKRAQ